MLFRKSGEPEEGEIVQCTVTKIYHHSVFANLDAYNTSGMLHISEVSPGRIRNLRDYVQEGKKIICKILRINKERGHIDLSLRRVNDSQRRKKLEEIKQEQKCEKMVELVAKKLKKDFKKLYEEIKPKIFEEYDGLAPCFEDASLADLDLTTLGIDKKVAAELTELAKQRIKPPEVIIGGTLTATSYAADGVDVIRAVLGKHLKTLGITYLGAGKYKVVVTAPDYKEAEKILQNGIDTIIAELEKNQGVGQFERQDVK